MDDISSTFAGTLAVSENNVHDQHPRYSDYKNEGKISESQRSRRLALIERQSKARNEHLDRYRSLFNANEGETLCNLSSDPILNEAKKEFPMDAIEVIQTNPRASKKRSEFSDILMHSEWLVDIPCDISTEWIMVPVPEGKRSLVVAQNGTTTIYSKVGYRLNQFQSDLPGGSRFNAVGLTMLDCILLKATKKIYVLDILCWGHNQYWDTEFSCRHFVLQSNLDNNPSLQQGSRFTFHILPSCKCNKEDMEKLLETEFEFPLDGVLFYFSNGYYHAGMTPLVGWLKPWMLPEILNINVPMKYLYAQGFYTSTQQFIEKFNEKHNFKSSIKKEENVHCEVKEQSDKIVQPNEHVLT